MTGEMTKERIRDGKLAIAITKEEAKKDFELYTPELKRKILASPELTEAERIDLLSRC